MNFWKAFFSSCLGAFVALVGFTILGIIFIAALGAEDPVEIKPNSVLSLNLSNPISELEIDDPIADLLPEMAEKFMGLAQIKEAIAHAKDDENIEGIYITSGSVGAGIASISEIRSSLQDFRSAGKWVVAYSNYYSEGGYYLASVCDSIFLNPLGEVELNGLATEVTFYKKLFDKLEIRPQVFRVGEFKSAVEPFLREDLSEENKLQLNAMLQSIYGSMLAEISESREIEPVRVQEIAGKMLVRNAKQAKEFSLVDDLLYEDEALNFLKGELGQEEDEALNEISYQDYRSQISTKGSSKNEIAVIVADGEIIDGKSTNQVVGSRTIIAELRKARDRENVKAIVLRINSPGGSAQASDDMWREIVLTSKVKPVIASMSDYAASGGYYLAMGCDTIVANPTTVTGSIGVFMFIPDISQFLGNKLGITSQEIKTGEIGTLLTVTRSLNDTEKSILQKQTEEIYETFTTKAADGRGMKVEDLRKIASGRVWTGLQARENGLVDVLGGLRDAVEIAATKAEISGDYKLVYYPKSTTFFGRYFSDAEEEATNRKMKEALGTEHALLLQQWKKIQKLQGVQARMPMEFRVY